MILLGSTKSKINKDKYGENVTRLEITEIMLVLVILITTIIRKNQEFSTDSFLINHLANY